MPTPMRPTSLLLLSTLLCAPAYAAGEAGGSSAGNTRQDLAGGGRGVIGEIEQSGTTTVQQKLQFAQEAAAEIDAAVLAVEKMLEQAKRSGTDAEAAKECLQEKLTALRTLQEVTRLAANRMDAALASSTGHADTEYRNIVVARDKAREFLGAAETCTAADDSQSGQTSSSVVAAGSDLVELDDVQEMFDIPVDASPH